ncbi:X antigen family member 5-like isoform X2 [Bos javanicus]|uniref:X antigen family member 5-like isoform X2 n=1 Tax=Bos javanicus TaxID=9906 RepID=UPI002AA78AD6|nr:X antigen family member 5-like isoform X2 [Bos javanicus]
MAPLGPSPLAPLRLPTAFESEWTQEKYQWASSINIGTYRSRLPKLDEPVVDQQPSVEQPQQEEPPTEIQDITAGKEEVNGEDPMNHYEEKEKDASGDSDLETDLQELAEAKTGGKGGDGPDVQEELASNTEPVEMPEAGEGQPFA